MTTFQTLLGTAAATLLSAGMAFAAGSDSTEPPTPTETTTTCEGGQIFDANTGLCVDVKSEAVTDDMRYEAARELAYAGAYDRALAVLASAENQSDPRILNYFGFTNRKLGNQADAEQFYLAAIEANPDYILARSYYGQGLATKGDLAGAEAQLVEIAQRGGEDTWAFNSLERAIGGEDFSY